MGHFLENFWKMASMDFGVLDGSCAELRDFVENTVCANLFQQVLGDGETASAILNDAL